MKEAPNKKVCTRCGVERPIEEFYKHTTGKDGHYTICKFCCTEYASKYRNDNPEKVKETAAKTREKNRQKIRERQREKYKLTKNDPEFKKKRKEYQDKSTPKQVIRRREKLIQFHERKDECAKCGESRKYLIQYHHIDPSTKSFSIGASINFKNDRVIQEEIKKCVCLCANCHKEFHWFYGNKPKNPVEDLTAYLNNDLGGTE